MTLNNQKEQFSIAYVRAVAAAAGFKISRDEVDDDSVDISIGRSGGNGTIRSPKCDIQLKCTSQDVIKDEVIHFALPLKNYNDLRDTDLHVPKILVILLVPECVSEWLKQNEQALLMHHCAYWQTLRGKPAETNKSSVTVHIPRRHIFDVAALTSIMDRIGQGTNP